MNKLLLAGAAIAVALTATPVLAQTNFVGPRVEGQVGLTTHDTVTYGANVGADFALGENFTLGAEAGATDFLKDHGRTLNAGARLGVVVHPNLLAYGRIGYANLDVRGDNLEGYTAGGGLNIAIAPRAYVNTEYRYTNYNQGVDSHAGLLGLGFRF